MTSSEMPTRIAMPQPFASGASATRATIESVSGDNLNYVDGFPYKYSLPASEGGKYVSRGEMNAIGNMASNDLHYFKCGGLNTFDAAFCAAVGGYPKGAVLDYIVGYKLHKVVSLIDNNTVDYTSAGIDGTNWQWLNIDLPEVDASTIVKIGTLENPGANGPILPLATMKAPTGGRLYMSLVSKTTQTTAYNLGRYPASGDLITYDRTFTCPAYRGTSLAYKIISESDLTNITYPSFPEYGQTTPSLNGWSVYMPTGFPSGGMCFFGFKIAGSGTSSYAKLYEYTKGNDFTYSIPYVEAGKYISFCLISGSVTGEAVCNAYFDDYSDPVFRAINNFTIKGEINTFKYEVFLMS